MKVVCDASVLIFLSKLGKLHLLKGHTILIPEQVYEEIKIGKAKEKEDYIKVDQDIQEGKIQIRKVEAWSNVPFTIGEGENAAIALAIKEQADIVLLDDAKGKRFAGLKNLKVKGTIGILMEAYRKGRQTAQETKQDIEKLIQLSFYIEEDVLFDIFEELKQGVKKSKDL